jgi:predicted DNA-binding transcriptional regulator YafY
MNGWMHPTRPVDLRADGFVLMRMQVSVDRRLRSWILGFGAAARVVAPLRLAQEIFEQIEDTRERYMAKADMLRMALPEGRAIGSRAGRLSTRAS